jgi:hypothetical protein
MSYREPQRTTARRTRSTILAVPVAACAVLIGILVYQSLPSPSSTAASAIDTPPGDPAPAVTGIDSDRPTPDHPRAEHVPGAGAPPNGRHPATPLGEEHGGVPDGVTVFDHEFPAVGKLDPALLGALQEAAIDAADDGVEIFVNSGWRSSEYQEQLLREAVLEYGSEEEAARWVSTAATSAHVSGDAIDIGPSDAMAWLFEHGADYGLCQIYGNEPWHFELDAAAIDHGCPPMYADPTHDPRMQQ